MRWLCGDQGEKMVRNHERQWAVEWLGPQFVFVFA